MYWLNTFINPHVADCAASQPTDVSSWWAGRVSADHSSTTEIYFWTRKQWTIFKENPDDAPLFEREKCPKKEKRFFQHDVWLYELWLFCRENLYNSSTNLVIYVDDLLRKIPTCKSSIKSAFGKQPTLAAPRCIGLSICPITTLWAVVALNPSACSRHLFFQAKGVFGAAICPKNSIKFLWNEFN